MKVSWNHIRNGSFSSDPGLVTVMYLQLWCRTTDGGGGCVCEISHGYQWYQYPLTTNWLLNTGTSAPPTPNARYASPLCTSTTTGLVSNHHRPGIMRNIEHTFTSLNQDLEHRGKIPARIAGKTEKLEPVEMFSCDMVGWFGYLALLQS